MKFDLHCHTSVSDGDLTPYELLDLAVNNGIELLAITDHDAVDGYLQCLDRMADKSEQAGFENIKLVSGVEFSCLWKSVGIHIIGLGFNPHSELMTTAVARLREIREQRGLEIAEKLAKKGLPDTYEGALACCNNEAWRIGRPHFAQYLVEKGLVSSRKKAFDRWLGAGKCGDVKHAWPSIEEAIGWINGSGGIAVVAHPMKYKMTNTRLKLLLSEFVAAGGRGIEVIGAGQSDDTTRYLARLCQEYELLASGGSDFHGVDMPWRKLGEISDIPKGCQAILELL